MSDKKSVSDEDKALFRQAVTGTKPATRRQDKVVQKPSTNINATYRRQQATQDNKPEETLQLLKTPLGVEDKILFTRSGLQHKQLKKLKQGQFQWQASLDLHGYSLAKAELAISAFIQHCQQQQFRYVTIIHGKGSRSPENKPLIKNLVARKLQEHPAILAICSAQPKDGGNGAVYIILKRTQRKLGAS